MKDEYDLSRAERGKFYRPNAKLNLPIYLDEEAQEFVLEIAKREDKDISEVVNEMIKTEKRAGRVGQ